MNIRWTPKAERDRQDIWDFIAEHDVAAADRMDLRFETAVARLAEFPLMGRPGAFAGTREFVPHPSYRVAYYVGGDTVWILALFHTSRQWPPVVE